ncbi:ABC transporter permease [Actinocorallia sp. B10E7]|uniref:ABC transporter permease n=1 Tax=Actinocorallia sp. B10E7 TaxID=3153558 RepID=UPI00325EEF3D
MRTALLIAGKDLRQRLRDRTLLMYALLLPLGLAFVFNVVFGGVGEEQTFRVGVVDGDRGTVATAFVDGVLKPVEESGAITLRTVGSREEGEKLVAGDDLAALFVIPSGFTAAVNAGEETGIEVVGNADSPVGVEVARSIATSFTSEVMTVRLSVAMVGGDAETAQRAAASAASAEAISMENITASDKQLDWSTYMATAMSVFFLFFTVQFGVSGMLEERENGTLPRLLTAPVSRTAVLAGKVLVSVFVGVMSMVLLMVAMALMFKVEWGSPVGLALLVPVGVLAATALMAAVAAFARGHEQAEQRQAVVAITLGALGGAFFPVAQLGGVMGAVSPVTPHYWFLRGLADLSGGASVVGVLPSVAALGGIAVLAGGVAAYGWSREAKA